jgi:transcriptional regulator with XRE-family HTH domain
LSRVFIVQDINFRYYNFRVRKVLLGTIDLGKNQRLLLVRQALGLSQKKFAEGIKLSKTYQGNIELGRQPVNDRLIKLISMTYGASEEWLKTGAGDMFDKIEDHKLRQIIDLFKKLDDTGQDCVLEQLEVYVKYHRKK